MNHKQQGQPPRGDRDIDMPDVGGKRVGYEGITGGNDEPSQPGKPPGGDGDIDMPGVGGWILLKIALLTKWL